MRATTDPATALAGTASLVLSVTAQALRRCLTQWKPHRIPDGDRLAHVVIASRAARTRRPSTVLRMMVSSWPPRVLASAGEARRLGAVHG
ncbi:hypothetical protein [Streptomyces sp. NPDC094468]|uniref:hypothetical protein n=1 Tax=Streptomyces sp. NPDC094468 TaxID=3366066 RepID=UPI0037FCDD0A